MSREQKVGLFFFLGILVAFVLVELTAGARWFRESYELWARYPDVQGLNVGDPVHVAGVKVGRVEEIRLAPEGVQVRMRVDRSAPVHADAVARLGFQALSGSRFVAISLGSPGAPLLRDGDAVRGEAPAGLTDMIDELQDVAASVRELADGLNANQERLLGNLNELLEENRRTISDMARHAASVARKLDQGDGTMAQLLNDPELYRRLARGVALAETVLADLSRVSGRLADGRGSIGRLLAEDELYDRAVELLVRLEDAATDLQAIVADVRDGRGSLGRLVNDDSLYLETRDAVRGLQRATAGIEDQSPMAILGTLVSTLF